MPGGAPAWPEAELQLIGISLMHSSENVVLIAFIAVNDSKLHLLKVTLCINDHT